MLEEIKNRVVTELMNDFDKPKPFIISWTIYSCNVCGREFQSEKGFHIHNSKKHNNGQ